MFEEKRKHFDEPWPRARHELDERLSKNDNEMKKRLLSQSENYDELKPRKAERLRKHDDEVKLRLRPQSETDDELKPRKDERQPQSENDNELKPRRTDDSRGARARARART